MKRSIRKHIRRYAGVVLGGIMMLSVPAVPALAEAEEITFDTEKTVVDAADGYFILKDPTTEKYGLYDSEGEEAIACDYDQMQFPDDTRQYDYVMVKQKSNWGVLSYNGKEKIELKYDSIDPYDEGRKVAAAYDGNVTDVFNDKGKKVGNLHGEYTVVTDGVFKGKEDLKTAKDSVILSLRDEKLLFNRKGTDVQIANVYQLGDNIVADYNVGSGNDSSKDEKYGKISTYRYIKVFDDSGNEKLKITPSESWTKDEEEEIRGGVRIDRVISDTNVIVRLMGYKNDYLAIYNTKTEEYSDLFRNISDFDDTNQEAFAADENGELCIVNLDGNKVTDGEITIDGYTRNGVKQTKHDPFIIFEKESGDKKYKLYSLVKGEALEETFNSVTFKKDKDEEDVSHGYPLVSDENDKFTILDHSGEILFAYGKYTKEELVKNTIYSDTNVTIVKNTGTKNQIYSYSITQPENGMIAYLKENPMIAVALVAIIILLLLIIVIIILLRKKAKEKKEQAKIMAKRREFEEKNRRKQRNASKRVLDGQNRFERRERMSNEDVTMRVEGESKPTYEYRRREHVSNPRPRITFYGQLRCLTGEYAGAKIDMQKGEWIRIGRDETENDLVMNNGKVSRKHCAISYDEVEHIYHVIDYSRNGVFLENGKKLNQNEETLVKEGSKIYLGNDQTVIQLARRR